MILLVACVCCACYVLAYLVESYSYYFRLAGHILGKKSLGWVLQASLNSLKNVIYLVFIFLLSLLVDSACRPIFFVITVLICLLGAGLATGFVLFNERKIVIQAAGYCEAYISCGSFLKTFLSRHQPLEIGGHEPRISFRKLCNVSEFKYSVLIYGMHAVGIFCSFFGALMIPKYRVTISQMSGLVNGAATVILTTKLDPMLSLKSEENSDFQLAFEAVQLGRIFGVLVFAPIFFAAVILVFLGMR